MSSALRATLLIAVSLSALLVITDGGVLPDVSLSKFNLKQNCQLCLFGASLVQYALDTQRGYSEVEKFTYHFCLAAKIQSPDVCANVTKLFNHEVVKVLSNGVLTPDQICGYMTKNACGSFHNPLADWEVNLNVSESLSTYEIERLRESQGLSKKSVLKPYRIVQISDTHVDLKYEPGSASVCDKPLCCHSDSRPLGNETIPAGYWGSYGACDIPMHTFESTLNAIRDVMTREGSIDYLIWTGDIQPHDVWEQSRSAASATYDAVFAKIFEQLPGITVLPTFGNHEMVPVDSFSPSNLLNIAREDSPEWLYKKISRFWSRWLPKDTINTVTKDGFYATMVRPGLKVVSLNTNFCHNVNFWLYINSTDPGNQLQWLIHELQLSELLHENVHIVGHIPPGGIDCLRVWSKNFNRIVQRYSRTISAQFYGHTHTSGFEVFYDSTELQRFERSNDLKDYTANQSLRPKPVSVAFIGPSVTSFIGLNPSFRIYTIDPAQRFMPVDFSTYYMNLTEANLKGANHEPEWTAVPSFAKDFGLKDISPASLHNLLLNAADEVNEDIAIRGGGLYDPIVPSDMPTPDEYNDANSALYKLYQVHNSYSDLFNQKVFSNITVNARLEFLCEFFTSKSHDFDNCKEFIHFSPRAKVEDFVA